MDERELTGGRLPGEVVEIYRRKMPQEVVECYRRPLPGAAAPERAEQTPVPAKNKSRKGLWIFLGCLTVIVVLAAAGWLFSFFFLPRLYPPAEPYFPDFIEEMAAEEITIPTFPCGQGAELTVSRDHGDPITIQEVYRQVNPAVVTVLGQLKTGYSVGTGVIFSSDGYVLTNHHVLAGSSACLVVLENGEQIDALFVASDADHDLAVLKMEAENLPVASFGDSDLLTVGDPAYAIGNPLGVELRGTLTDGIISAINRDVQIGDKIMSLIQTDAALNTGNSGGPLINQYGQVVGINVVKMTTRQYDSATVEGLGFAIPTSILERVVNDLLTYGEVQPEPLLGISVYNTPTKLDDHLVGAGIESVTPGGASDRAGIRQGDYILAIGEMDVSTSQDVLRARRQHHVGDEMTMTLWRDGVVFDVTLQLNEAAE